MDQERKLKITNKTENPDHKIIRRILKGDINAFELLVKKYEKPIFILVYNLLRQPHVTEDFAQDTFLAAFKNIRSFNPKKSSFSTWLFKIAKNKCLNEMKRKKEITISKLPEPVIHKKPTDDLLVAEAFVKLDNALDLLSLKERSIFILKEFDDLSYEEISEIEGIKIGTVKSRLSRTKEKLRSILKDYLG